MVNKKRSEEFVEGGKDVRLPSGNVMEIRKVASCCNNVSVRHAYCTDKTCDNNNCGFKYVI